MAAQEKEASRWKRIHLLLCDDFDAVIFSRSHENKPHPKTSWSLVWKTRPPSKQRIRLWGLNDVYIIQLKRLCFTRGSSRLWSPPVCSQRLLALIQRLFWFVSVQCSAPNLPSGCFMWEADLTSLDTGALGIGRYLISVRYHGWFNKVRTVPLCGEKTKGCRHDYTVFPWNKM